MRRTSPNFGLEHMVSWDDWARLALRGRNPRVYQWCYRLYRAGRPE